jgi:vancomycin resistance protein YoaR
VLTHGEERHVWEPADLAALVRIEPVDGSLTVGLNEERLSERVEGLAQVVDSGSVEPRVRFENGNLFIVQPGQQGWRLLQDEAIAVISATLQHRTERTVALPVEDLQPRVTPDMLASLGIHELVGEGRSSFAGSEAYRITNIKAGVAAMDGVLIAPDEEFSFNTQLGPVDGEHGFVQGYAIVNSRTALEWGGGVCQNSTTVFRAAFWAGLPITEWHPHPFYLNWYDPFGYGAYGNGPGMDATIFTGVQDFKFVNDTGNWLLLQFYVDDVNQVITVHLYGTSPEREVRFDGPYISNQRGGGAQDITVFRTIVEGGVPQEPEPFFTSFKPW